MIWTSRQPVYAALHAAAPDLPVISVARDIPFDQLRAAAPEGQRLGRLQAAEPVWLLPEARLDGIDDDTILAAIGMVRGNPGGAEAVLELTDWDLDASVSAHCGR